MPKIRDHNLDLVRASAILLVVIYHIGVMWPLEQPFLRRFTSLGAYGVDLFFVLSGWLIGGLYWRERLKFGDVDLPRFWLRRALRTMPPYFVALPIIWYAAYFARREPFNPLYLAFMQDYLHEMPFFLASWSLCVEEHFYLALPLIVLLAAWLRFPEVVPFVLLVFLPPIARLIDPFAGAREPFGYAETATHLRISGIALGVLCAYLSVMHVSAWGRLQDAARWLAIPSIVAFATIVWWPEWARYYLGFEAVALIFTCLIASVAGRHVLPLAGNRWVFRIALWSYSIYLTHGLVIHACLRIRNRFTWLPTGVHLAIWCGLILLVGMLFYIAVEATSIQLRDRLVRRRTVIGSTLEGSVA